MIGKRLSSLANVLNRQDVEIYVNEQLLDEIRMIISRPKFVVDYIISGDKDLTDLGSHADIPILSYANFVTMLSLIEKDNN